MVIPETRMSLDKATLDSSSLRQFTRALTCLSRYGEDLIIYATPDLLSLSTTNSSKSAYCRFQYKRQFFSRLKVGNPAVEASTGEDAEETPSVMGQLLTKTLLPILKHRAVEKSVEKCEMYISTGDQRLQDVANDDDVDSLESKLTVRLHCKHGVIKTHRLSLLIPTSLLAPSVPETFIQSRLRIGPQALRDIVEHFPSSRGSKSDPQLVWRFNHRDVQVKSLENSIDGKGKVQLSTELTISKDEFDNYDICDLPTTIAFHLREFNATIAYAEASSLTLDISFTDPSAPLFIMLDSDSLETLFVISTSLHVARDETSSAKSNEHSSRSKTTLHAHAKGKKRTREEETASTPNEDTSSAGMDSRDVERLRPALQSRKPARIVVTTDQSSNEGESHSEMPMSLPRSSRGTMPPPSLPPPLAMSAPREAFVSLSEALFPPPSHPRKTEPLFLPSSQPSEENVSIHERRVLREPLFLPGTQLSQADEQAIRESGLGIEHMTAEELTAMLEGDAEDVNFGVANGERDQDRCERETSLDIYDEMEMGPTQRSGGPKAFRPLFED
ncbi:uncharacterized protein FIBRA_00613 [Fibroporia radiculosa]|uniref:Cell cycle checkpoint control protein n=1 Tax=Fibroporia radiculosa TaxID=599839 RepID=J4I813_9APHY|nr:uncharacterized protein FIBRA_00613 [Fibroporia radiculosa]CCL98611.1 predicted protein [Fibroporia radiculosa]